MTWVDAVVVCFLGLSGLFGFMAGFVGRVLGRGAWIAAALLAVWAEPAVKPRFTAWIPGHPGLDTLAAYVSVFLGSVLVLLIISHAASRLVRRSALGGVDRSLGLLFGLAEGAALVVIAYIIGGLVAGNPRDWPLPVRNALALGPTYQGAAWAVRQLPAEHRPQLYSPPAGRPATAEALMRAVPRGRATEAAAPR